MGNPVGMKVKFAPRLLNGQIQSFYGDCSTAPTEPDLAPLRRATDMQLKKTLDKQSEFFAPAPHTNLLSN